MENGTDSDDEERNVEIVFETTWQNKWIDFIWDKTGIIFDKNKIGQFIIYSITYDTTFAKHLHEFRHIQKYAKNRSSVNVSIDFCGKIYVWKRYEPSWAISGNGFTYHISCGAYLQTFYRNIPRYDFKQIYVAHHMKWLNLLAIYNQYVENPDACKNITNGERILYDDYLLQKLIQY